MRLLLPSRGWERHVDWGPLHVILSSNGLREMKRTQLNTRAAVVLALLLPIFASACIVVVEEDDRDRRRYLHGSEWYLEVVFYRTETAQAADRNVQIAFSEDGFLTGNAECGAFNGLYEVNDNGGIEFSDVDVSQNCSGQPVTELVIDGLRSARTYEVDEHSLRIETDRNGYLSFTAE